MKLTVVMYHYVRDLKRSRFPEIKGLDYSLFQAQIAYLEKHYQFVSLEQCIRTVEAREALPPNPVLLTFDDGYADHYQTVFPVLFEKKIPGLFFPPAEAILERKLLDVNKIHYILASARDLDGLIKETLTRLGAYRATYNLPSNEALFEKLAVANRFDPKEVIFFKRLLQRELPPALRDKLSDELFERYVSRDRVSFAAELYMSLEQIRLMQSCGMDFGSHGWSHLWLNSLTDEEQDAEIARSVEFLNQVGVAPSRRSMCYPYGGYNESTLSIAREHGFKLGFTTAVAVADLTTNNALTLERLDTNDLPKRADAPFPAC